ncbi:carboxypeptidase-like regulatory domain-containing protein [Flavobacterium sp. P21]|uniref:carboxypeptidase-like regulatory domain-containing protein n=1 Tax=Flavobacterium sp. P21 TaxID=3423948 RepID=UPI003D670239
MKLKYIGFFIALMCTAVSFGQIKITGTVKDKATVPIPGVNIVVKGTSTNTSTDFDGKFAIEVPNKNAQIELSFVGFTNKIVPVGDKTNFDIVLEEASQALDEIVVVGYRCRKKERCNEFDFFCKRKRIADNDSW